jgi:glycosyltransferase involved in cell wall biosynthesis
LNPIVSLIVPVRNRADLLVDALESVAPSATERLDYEVIVVDDGSEAAEARKIDDACASTPKCVYVRMGQNRGAWAARNVGIERATGEFIKFLDSDDILLPGALREEYEIVESAGADVLISGWLRAELGDKLLSNAKRGVPEAFPSSPYDAILNGHFAPVASLLYRRKVVGDLRWSPEIRHPDDWLFRIKVFLRDPKVVTWDKPVFVWREHSGPRQSRVSNIEYAKARFFILTYVRDEIAKRAALTDQRRYQIANYLYRDVYVAHLHDREHYKKLVSTIESLAPGFRPNAEVETHRAMKLLGSIVGFRTYVPLHNFLRSCRDWLRRRGDV